MVNKKKSTIIISEVAQSHNADISKAKDMIYQCKISGADYVKFQAHYADHESTFEEPFRSGHKFKEKTRFDYWKKNEFSRQQWSKLYNFAKKIDIGFLCSPFSVYSFKLLRSLGLRTWKIGSGEFFSDDLIAEILKYKKDDVILSTGLANIKEISNRVNLFKKKKNFVLLQCTTEYPSKLDNVGANIIEMFKKKYKCKVGLSDHTGTVFPSLFSISREYDYLEVHVDYKNSKNPDSSSSITFEDLKLICDYRDNFFKFKNQNIDKNNMPLKIKKLKKMFTKSIALKRNLDKGEAIEIENITLKKPGTGIPHSDLKKILGKSAKNKIYSFNLLKWSDVE